nr:MAG TPA: hypothetical protein [Caudoviricetes sp.]
MQKYNKYFKLPNYFIYFLIKILFFPILYKHSKKSV